MGSEPLFTLAFIKGSSWIIWVSLTVLLGPQVKRIKPEWLQHIAMGTTVILGVIGVTKLFWSW